MKPESHGIQNQRYIICFMYALSSNSLVSKMSFLKFILEEQHIALVLAYSAIDEYRQILHIKINRSQLTHK